MSSVKEHTQKDMLGRHFSNGSIGEQCFFSHSTKNIKFILYRERLSGQVCLGGGGGVHLLFVTALRSFLVDTKVFQNIIWIL